MRKSTAILLLTLLVAGCAGSEQATPERTQRESDSVVGQSQLPGASGVKKAMAEQDSARARAAAVDSLAAAQ